MRVGVLGMVLAGGEGKRLGPLTVKRAKPAVPFGGKYRIIDFVLSNFVNSGINSIFVLTQYRSQSLTEHLINGWNISNIIKGQFIIPVPAQMRTSKNWYQGTADAIFQNIHLIEDFKPDVVAVFGGDHIYRMDVSQMIKYHTEKKAIATVAAIPVLRSEANQFGIIQVDENARVIGFQEKPNDPIPIPGNPDMCYASMGNYIFNSDMLISELTNDAGVKSSSHDFGKNIIPDLVESKKLFAYNFFSNKIEGFQDSEQNYWRDVGTLKSYYDANMDLRSPDPQLDLYNKLWPLYSYNFPGPPAKFVHNEEVSPAGMPRIGKAINSLISNGCIISGSTVTDSLLSPDVYIHSYSTVAWSILFDDVEIAENCSIRNTIIDKHTYLPPGTKIGYDIEEDKKRYHVETINKKTGEWLTVIGKKGGPKLLPSTAELDIS